MMRQYLPIVYVCMYMRVSSYTGVHQIVSLKTANTSQKKTQGVTSVASMTSC